VVIQTSWNGWALPSLQITLLATVLVAVLYTIVPEGRGATWASGPRPGW
jgi:hypothetical protein